MHRGKDNRSRTEGDKQTGREKQKCTGMERDKEMDGQNKKKKTVDKEKEKKRYSIHSKNQAAVVIQRVWRRYWCLYFFPFTLEFITACPFSFSSIGFKYLKSPWSNKPGAQNS